MHKDFSTLIILAFFALAPAMTMINATTVTDTHSLGQTSEHGQIQQQSHPHAHNDGGPKEGTSTNHGRLRILMMIPVFDFNRSHVNFALGKFRVLRQHHHVDFVLPYFADKDIAFLKDNLEKELLDEIQIYKLKNPDKIVKEAESVKKAREALEEKARRRKEKNVKKKKATKARKERQKQHANGNQEGGDDQHKKVVKRSVDEEGDKDADPEPTDELAAIDAEKEQKAKVKEKPFEEMTQLGEILQYPKSFSKRMEYFPYIWIDMLESGHFAGKEYDVGIAEYELTSQYAFAVFEALKIPHLIVSRNYSPIAQNLADLGLLLPVMVAQIPPVEATNIGDHRIERSAEGTVYNARTEQFIIDHATSLKNTTEMLAKIDKKLFGHLADKLPTFHESIQKGQSALRQMFRRATHFLVNSHAEMEFDEGQLLGQATNGGGEKKVKMICGIHMEEEQMEKHNNGQTMEAQTAMDPNIIDKDKENNTRILEIRDKMAGFAGYVLISFGSVVDTKTKGPEMFIQMEAIVEAIRLMPNYLFIWQLTKGDPLIEEVNNNDKVPNVFATHWVDLQGILVNPLTMAFISHCGKNSMFESLYHGVAPVCVPIFGEQFYNAETAARHQYGTSLDFYCIQLDAEAGHGHQERQFTIPYFKLSGQTNLLPLPKDHKEKSHLEKQKKFYELNKETTKKGEDRIVPVFWNKNEFCFHQENIKAAVEQAIRAKNGQNAKGHISGVKLHDIKQKLREHSPHKILLKTMKEIVEMEQNTEK